MNTERREAARQFFGKLFATTGREEAQAVVNLAGVQWELENLAESGICWGSVITRPEDAADASVLRGLLDAAESFGYSPEEDSAGEFALMLAEGYLITWPAGGPPDA